MQNADYWQKLQPITDNSILWNIPEQKTGRIAILGGNLQNCMIAIKNTEFLNSLPIKTANLLLPDVLQGKLPTFSSLYFAESTESGSFTRSNTLEDFTLNSDLVLYSGDFSKNSITEIAITDTLKKLNPNQLAVLSRDTVDLITADIQGILERQNLILIASLAQLQKVFRAALYPKMILLSMPIFPVIEILHKFTLSYPCTIFTFHQNQIIIARSGIVHTIAIDKTSYTPLSLWSGNLACKISALALWNPQNLLEATETALFWDHRQK